MNVEGDVYLCLRAGLMHRPCDVLDLLAPERWRMVAKLRDDLEEEKRLTHA